MSEHDRGGPSPHQTKAERRAARRNERDAASSVEEETGVESSTDDESAGPITQEDKDDSMDVHQDATSKTTVTEPGTEAGATDPANEMTFVEEMAPTSEQQPSSDLPEQIDDSPSAESDDTIDQPDTTPAVVINQPAESQPVALEAFAKYREKVAAMNMAREEAARLETEVKEAEASIVQARLNALSTILVDHGFDDETVRRALAAAQPPPPPAPRSPRLRRNAA